MLLHTYRLVPTPALFRWAAIAALASVLVGVRPPAYGQDPLEITSDASTVSVKAAGQQVAIYQLKERPRKPYLKELFSPGGVNVVRDAPADHLHHHGLMFAVAVDGVDFWSENEKCGHERHAGLSDALPYEYDGLSWCGFTQRVDWVGADGKSLLLEERRIVDVCRVPDAGATVLAWRCRLGAPPGKQSVTLSGSPYFGLGMRFVVSMDADGQFQNADRKTGVEGTNAVRSAWCAYSAVADGKPVTVAMFDSPNNPRHPATWFTMNTPFAYLAVTLNLSKEPLVIEAEKPLELQYAVAVWDGHVKAEKIDTLYARLRKWAAEVKEP